jgi:hypothetical protein
MLGLAAGLFTHPSRINTDSSDNVYVADFGSPDTTAQKLTNKSTFLLLRGSFALDVGQFIILRDDPCLL